MIASMTIPVLVAIQDTKTSEVPITNKIGLWQHGNTDPSNTVNTAPGCKSKNGDIYK